MKELLIIKGGCNMVVVTERGQELFNSFFDILPVSIKLILMTILYIALISPLILVFTFSMCDSWVKLNKEINLPYPKKYKIVIKKLSF